MKFYEYGDVLIMHASFYANKITLAYMQNTEIYKTEKLTFFIEEIWDPIFKGLVTMVQVRY